MNARGEATLKSVSQSVSQSWHAFSPFDMYLSEGVDPLISQPIIVDNNRRRRWEKRVVGRKLVRTYTHDALLL